MDRILLVDDDVEVRPLLEHILLDNGYQVVAAESVATATRLPASRSGRLGLFAFARCQALLRFARAFGAVRPANHVESRRGAVPVPSSVLRGVPRSRLAPKERQKTSRPRAGRGCSVYFVATYRTTGSSLTGLSCCFDFLPVSGWPGANRLRVFVFFWPQHSQPKPLNCFTITSRLNHRRASVGETRGIRQELLPTRQILE